MMEVLENRVLRRIFGPKRDEVTGEWRKIHNKDLIDLYSSTVVQVIQSRIMRWAGYVARIVEKRGVNRILVGNLKKVVYLGYPDIEGKIILRWIYGKWDMGVWTGSRWLRIGTVGGLL
jgi:hypothetical protein